MRTKQLFHFILSKFRIKPEKLTEFSCLVDSRRSRNYKGRIPIKGGKVPADGTYNVEVGELGFVMTINDCMVVIKRENRT